MQVARLIRRTGRVVALAGCLALASLATPAFAQDPPGNNGTVKIDNAAFDSNPNNEPHVDCVFQVDFYGYDKGDFTAHVTFETQPPTDPAKVLLQDDVFIGGDDSSGGGSEAGLDASETYTLDFTGLEPHDKQGFHVKLTINAPGSQGADVKHKVFWVQPCPTQSPSPSKTPTHAPTPKPTPSKSAETPVPVPTAVPGGVDDAGGGSGAGLLGLALATSGVVAGTVAIARRRLLNDS